MTLRISNKMQVVRGSVIRQMAEAAATQEGAISFANGNPSSDTFMVEEFARFAADIFYKDPNSVLQYGLSQGYPPLIHALKFGVLTLKRMTLLSFLADSKPVILPPSYC